MSSKKPAAAASSEAAKEETAAGSRIWLADQIELWPTARLEPYARNAKRHPPEQIERLAAAIRRFGFTQPILVGEDDGIVAGEGRWRAAQELEMPEVPVILLDHLPTEARRELVIVDNRLAEWGVWDDDLLAGELAAMVELGAEPLELGFSDSDLEELFGAGGGDDKEEPEGEPVSFVRRPKGRERFGAAVVCDNAGHQAEVLRELAAEGYTVEAVTL